MICPEPDVRDSYIWLWIDHSYEPLDTTVVDVNKLID
jgi:hypothetical protein